MGGSISYLGPLTCRKGRNSSRFSLTLTLSVFVVCPAALLYAYTAAAQGTAPSTEKEKPATPCGALLGMVVVEGATAVAATSLTCSPGL